MKSCPYYRETKNLSQETERLLRRMRKTLRICQTCPEASDCPAYQNLGQLVRNALDDLASEWESRS